MVWALFKKTIWLVGFVLLYNCTLKDKTTLHLERELQFLDNVKEVNANLGDSLFVNKVAVIRDSDRDLRTLVLSLSNTISDSYFEDNYIQTRAKYFNNSKLKEENKRFVPLIKTIKGKTYLISELETEAPIFFEEIYFLLSNGSQKSPSFKLKHLRLNND